MRYNKLDRASSESNNLQNPLHPEALVAEGSQTSPRGFFALLRMTANPKGFFALLRLTVNPRQSVHSALALSMLLVLTTVACKGGGDFIGNTGKKNSAAVSRAVETFTIGSEKTPKTDIAFFLDTSTSMVEEYSSVVSGLQRFVDKIATGESVLDVQLFLLGNTTKYKVELNDLKIVDIRNLDVNSHSGLWSAYNFLAGNTDKVPSGRLNLRPDAIKELIFVTDDDATAITADNFLPYLKENRSHLNSVHFNGFVGLPNSQITSTCKISNVGSSYIKLGNDSEFGGQMYDICNADWDGLLSDLAEGVRGRAGRGTSFVLKGTPANEKVITVMIDGKETLNFTYNKSKKQINLDASKISGGIHKVTVSY